MTETSDQPSPEDARPVDDLAKRLSRRVVGQPDALRRIIPYVQMHQTGLAPEGRPVGVFLLLGPTGTGKTRTVEALAEVLHGDPRRLVRIDCGEFQSEHEVAKLIGAPPGYVGHMESQPQITQERLGEVTTDDCDLSLILFDEIEKASPSMTVLLLGILDKALLRLGGGGTVDFQKSLIFLTSNLGARGMMDALHPSMGFRASDDGPPPDIGTQLERIGMVEVRRRFSPEFVNRIDVIVTYQPLDTEAVAKILDQQIADLQQHVHSRLGRESFDIHVTDAARAFLSDLGTSAEFGARELKRVIHRHLTQPLAAKVASGEIEAGSEVEVGRQEDGEGLAIRVVGKRAAVPASEKPTILVVDDNEQLLNWLQLVLEGSGFKVLAAGTLGEAERLATQRPDMVLLDYLLPDGDGCELGLRLRTEQPRLQVALMTGLELPPEEEAICKEKDIPVLRKPFLAAQVRSLIQARIPSEFAARAGS